MRSWRDADRKMLITNVAWKRRRRHFDGQQFIGNVSIYLYFALSVVWLELMFHIRFFDGIGIEIVHTLLFSVCLSAVPAFVCSLLPGKAGKVVTIVFSALIFVVFSVQAVYYEIFKTFLIHFGKTEYGQVQGYLKLIPGAVASQWLTILLYALPLLFYVILGRKFIGFCRLNILHTAIVVAGAVIVHILLLFTLRLYGTGVNGPYYLYNKEFIPNVSMEKLGLMTTMRIDLKNVIFGKNSDGSESGQAGGNDTKDTPPASTKPVIEIITKVYKRDEAIYDFIAEAAKLRNVKICLRI